MLRILGVVLGVALGLFAASRLGLWGGGASLEESLAEAAADLNTRTPMMLDPETRLDRVVAEGKRLHYDYTLVRFGSEEIDAEKLRATAEPALEANVCSSMKAIVELGGTVSFTYHGKNGNEVLLVTVPPSRCT